MLRGTVVVYVQGFVASSQTRKLALIGQGGKS